MNKNKATERKIPRKGEMWRHFKGGMYKIVNIATHTETEENFVIYHSEGAAFNLCARPLAMFMSEVDRKKYPEAKQKYRFERVGNTDELKPCPFCGSPADIYPIIQQDGTYASAYNVYCTNEDCGAIIYGDDDAEKVASMWNKRMAEGNYGARN